MPTFMIFKQGKQIEKIQGADPRKLQDVVKKLAAEAEGTSSAGFGGSSSDWRVGELPKGYGDVTDQVDVKGLELLNADGEFGGVRTLFEHSKPSALGKGKGGEGKKDWVESDTDEQLMLFVPFQATLKVHTIQVRFHDHGILHCSRLTQLLHRLLLSHLAPPTKTKTISLFVLKPFRYTPIAHTFSDSMRRMIFLPPNPSL